MYVPPNNGLKPKILTYSVSIDSITQLDHSLIQLLILYKIFLKRFIQHIFRINHYFSGKIEINRSKLYVFITFFVFPINLSMSLDI